MAKDFKLMGEAYASLYKKSKETVVEQDLGPGFEPNNRLDEVLKDFNVDIKNKTKVIEFLISLSNNKSTTNSALQTADQKPSAQISTMKPANTSNYLPK